MREIEGEAKAGKPRGLIPKLALGAGIVALQLVISLVVTRSIIQKPAAVPVEAEEEQAADSTDFDDVYLVEDVILNPSGLMGRKIVNTTVAFAYKGKAGAELEKREVQIRDMLIQIMGACSASQLIRPTFRDSLRWEILARARELLKKGEITGVYFANFVMQ